MDVSYTIFDPTGNITLLVTSPVPVPEQPALAKALMAREPAVEQVGFLCPPEPDCRIAVRMAGGEFCGNATLSAAALWALDHGLPADDRLRVHMSGAAKPLDVALTPCPGGFAGVVDMPLPTAVARRSLPLEGEEAVLPVVDFGRTSHVLLERPLSREAAERTVKTWCGLLDRDCLGLMLLDRERRLTPLVYVPAADTLYWEHSCASGTAAVGAALATREGQSLSLSLAQPGGALSIRAELSAGRLVSLRLGGQVRVLARVSGAEN